MSFVYTPKEKSFETLIEDMYAYIAGTAGDFEDIYESDAKELGQIIADVVIDRFKERRESSDFGFRLRMSNYGLPNRRLWFEANTPRKKGHYKPETYLNFLYGDILEAIVLFVAKKAGHKVECQQETVEYAGIVGHLDAVIDGVVTDVKSASAWSFNNKFKDGGLLKGKDSFAYIPQISGYGEAKGIARRAFLVANKERGELCALEVPRSMGFDVAKKAEEARKAISSPEPPSEKCYPDEKDGESGNRVLSKDCSFCPFKKACWADANGGRGLRTFKYAKGPIHFTHVVKEPKVEEITDEYEEEIDGA